MIVLRTVTLMTVKIRLRPENRFLGKTAAIAMAAETPQIATDPLVISASRQPRPNNLAASNPKAIVASTAGTSRAIVEKPSPISRLTLTRTPSKATPVRSTFLAANSMPTMHLPSSERK